MKIQINQCAKDEIEWLPGVGPATAQKIMEARPIENVEALQQIVPPSAWLKIEEAGVEFGFGAEVPEGILDLGQVDIAPDEFQKQYAEAAGKEPLTDEEKRAALPLPPEPPIILQEPEPMLLRRVKPGEELQHGASYLCLWNIRLGPGGEARLPADESAQAEVSGWFQDHGMDITFAHYGPSVKVYTRNMGAVPLVLFEIVKETENGSDSQAD